VLTLLRNRLPALTGRLFLLLILSAPLTLMAAPELHVAFVAGSGNAALDRHITSLLREHLNNRIELQAVPQTRLPAHNHIPVVTIGPAAFNRYIEAGDHTPILALLIDRRNVENHQGGPEGRLSAVYFDVPLVRQALTGKAILPHATRVSMLASLASAEMYESVIEQLPRYGLEGRVFIVSSDDQLIPTLNRALSYGDFVLAGLDDTIYNPRNIKHILLTAYRRNRILIGPSQPYVKAGALASGYAPFEAMAKQAAEALLAYFDSGKLPAPGYPDQYRVDVNQQVARSLNIALPNRKWIAETVDHFIQDQQEAQP